MERPYCQTLDILTSKLQASVIIKDNMIGAVATIGERRQAAEQVTKASAELRHHQLECPVCSAPRT